MVDGDDFAGKQGFGTGAWDFEHRFPSSRLLILSSDDDFHILS